MSYRVEVYFEHKTLPLTFRHVKEFEFEGENIWPCLKIRYIYGDVTFLSVKDIIEIEVSEELEDGEESVCGDS